MPKHKKSSSSSSDSDSGPDDRNPPAKKPAPSTSAKKKTTSNEKKPTSNGDEGWHLGSNRFANVREFKGKIMVDIREFYEKDGQLLPGKKGISLSAKQWQMFKDIVDDIDKKVSDMA